MGAARGFKGGQLKVLGIILCLLAGLFAVESKIAWFSPAGSSAAHISSAKLQAADAPRLIARALARTAPAVHVPEIFAALALVVFSAPLPIRVASAQQEAVGPLPGYFPSLFFRPPPVR